MKVRQNSVLDKSNKFLYEDDKKKKSRIRKKKKLTTHLRVSVNVLTDIGLKWFFSEMLKNKFWTKWAVLIIFVGPESGPKWFVQLLLYSSFLFSYLASLVKNLLTWPNTELQNKMENMNRAFSLGIDLTIKTQQVRKICSLPF